MTDEIHMRDWPVGRALRVDGELRDEHDILTIVWGKGAGKTEGYIRLGSLDDDLRRAVLRRMTGRADDTQALPKGLSLPRIGVGYSVGGKGSCLIQLTDGVLSVTTEGDPPVTMSYTAVCVTRKSNGVSFICDDNVQRVFTFTDRPIASLPPDWEALPLNIELRRQ